MPELGHAENPESVEQLEQTVKIEPCVRGLRPAWHEDVIEALMVARSSNDLTSEGAATIIRMLGITT